MRPRDAHQGRSLDLGGISHLQPWNETRGHSGLLRASKVEAEAYGIERCRAALPMH